MKGVSLLKGLLRGSPLFNEAGDARLGARLLGGLGEVVEGESGSKGADGDVEATLYVLQQSNSLARCVICSPAARRHLPLGAIQRKDIRRSFRSQVPHGELHVSQIVVAAGSAADAAPKPPIAGQESLCGERQLAALIIVMPSPKCELKSRSGGSGIASHVATLAS
jgi:hypothetical protein